MTKPPIRLPDDPALANRAPDGRQSAPSAERNAGPILRAMAPHMPARGEALEIASGTGQHIVGFAAACPSLRWYPTEANPDRLPSIRAWIAQSGLTNIAAPAVFDATCDPWPREGLSAVVLVNLLHLVPHTAAQRIIGRTARALSPGGVFILYGPFRRQGAYASPGDRSFDIRLRAQDRTIGYKDVDEVAAWAEAAGLLPEACHQMPANNLLWALRRPMAPAIPARTGDI